MGRVIRVYLETEKTWTWACAVDLPGWQRRGKGEAAAVEELESYRDRYAEATGTAPVGELQVVGRLTGGASSAWAFSEHGPWDSEAVSTDEIAALERCWTFFDTVAGRVSAELRKGPRGGGRDRDAIVDHVREAERAYGRKLGARVPPRTPWADQRREIASALAEPPEVRWPPKYAARRIAWHVLDHAWEMEDKDLG